MYINLSFYCAGMILTILGYLIMVLLCAYYRRQNSALLKMVWRLSKLKDRFEYLTRIYYKAAFEKSLLINKTVDKEENFKNV